MMLPFLYLRRALLRFQAGVGGPSLLRFVLGRLFVSFSVMLTSSIEAIFEPRPQESGVPSEHGKQQPGEDTGVHRKIMPFGVCHFAILLARSSKRNGPLVLCLTGGNA